MHDAELKRVIMVSYDRELLDSASATSKRVMSIAGDGLAMDVIVMQGKIWKNIWKGIGLAKKLKGQAVVTAQDPFAAGLVGYLISRWTNAPLEIQEHGDFYSGAWVKESWKNRALSCLGKFILRRAERVRAVSERVKDHLVRIGIDEKRIDVIPVSMDLSKLLTRPVHRAGYPFRVVIPCRFVEQKGLDRLLDATKILAEKKLPVVFTFIGQGRLEKNLKLQTYGFEYNRIEAWKNPDEIWDEADLFVMSSRYEGWGRTIVEAMAAGVPIVTTDVGCVGSFFRPQIDGRVVQPNDAEGLAKAIEEQINEPERREAMRISARERAKTFLSRDELHLKQRNGWKSMLGVGAHGDAPGPRFELWVAAFIAFVILTRAASVILFHSSLLNREWGFFTLVQHWFQGLGYTYFSDPGCLSAYRSPGFLFFLTGIYTIFSPSNTWAQAIIQNLFVVGILWLVYALGKRLVGKRAALVAGFLMACYPYTFYHYTQFYHTFLSSFFLLLLVWFSVRFAESKRYRYALGAGFGVGALAYVQGTILIACPFIALWILLRLWPDWKRAFWGVAIIAIVSAGMIAPWTYRNWKAFHTLIPLTTDLGFGLYKANNENIYQLTLRGYPQEVVDVITVSSTDSRYVKYNLRPEIVVELQKDGVYRDEAAWTMWHPRENGGDGVTCAMLGPQHEVEHDAHWKALAMDWIKTNWWTDGLKLQVLKLKTFWQPSLFPSVKMGAPWSFAGDPLKEFLARWSVTAAAAIVIVGGWIGVIMAVIRRDKNVWLPLMIVLIYSFMHTFFAGYTKYRIPLDNIMVIYAGATIVGLWDWIRHRKKRL